MSTYTTYQAAKIANPSKEILKARDDWEGCPESIGKFIANKPNSEGGEPYIGKGWFEICNPADYCMSLSNFHKSGYRLVYGDLIIGVDWSVVKVSNTRNYNQPWQDDDKRYVLKSKALEETNTIPTETTEEKEALDEKTYRYEKVEASEAVYWFTKTDDALFAEPDSSQRYDDLQDYINNLDERGSSSLYRRIEVTDRELEIEEMAARLCGVAIPIDASKLANKLHELGFGLVNGKG